MNHRRAGILAGILAALLYGATLGGYGPVSDEGNYFESSRRLAGWGEYFTSSWQAGEPARAFETSVVGESWRWGGDRIPHPPFAREVAGLSGLLFYGHMDPLLAYRLLGVVLAGVLVGGVTAWGTLRAGLFGGLFAGAAFLLMPRVFAHAHFATTDFLLTGLWFFALFCAAEARRWPLAGAGALWGLGLATKFSAVLLPFVLVPWLALFRRDRLRELPLFLGVGALTFALVNPALWMDPAGALHEYVRQGAGRSRITMAQLPTFYLGRLYSFRPPWHYPFVMMAVTTPPAVLLLAACGAVTGLRRPALRPLAALALLTTTAFMAVLMLPSAPLHDDVRLFLPVFPFVALLAALGAVWIAGLARHRLVAPALLTIALAEPAVATARLHPHQASYFNALVGGVAGASASGLEVTGLKEVLNRSVYRDLNRLLPAGAVLDGGPFLYEDLLFAQSLGWLRPDVVVRARPPSGYVLIVNRRGWLRGSDTALLQFAEPAYALSLEGVPLLALYRLR